MSLICDKCESDKMLLIEDGDLVCLVCENEELKAQVQGLEQQLSAFQAAGIGLAQAAELAEAEVRALRAALVDIEAMAWNQHKIAAEAVESPHEIAPLLEFLAAIAAKARALLEPEQHFIGSPHVPDEQLREGKP